MSRLALIVFFSMLTSLSGTVCGTDWAEVNSLSSLSEDEVQSLVERAVSGDSESSYKLAVRYGNHQHFNIHNYLFFLRLSGEQGNCEALLEFARWMDSKTMLDDFKTPGEWRKRALACAKRRGLEE